jgi:hypothetical protein
MKKVALVIGNGDYRFGVKLKNPTNDSRDIKSSLEKLGFKVIYGENLKQIEFKRVVRDFSQSSIGAEIALFYFAGHGIQYGGRNFLVPIDSDILNEDEIPDNTISLDFIQNRVDDTKAKLNLFFLDSCRNNPFEDRISSFTGRKENLSRGLVNPMMQFTNQSIITFATAPNEIALDNPKERNGIFTKHLLKFLASGLKIDDILKKTVKSVIDDTQSKQIPWVHQKLYDDFYLGEQKEISEPPKIVEVEKVVYRDREIPVYIEKEKEFSFEEIPVVSKRFEKLDKKFLVFGSILTIVALSLGYSEYSERELKAQLERERKSRMFLNIPQSFSRNGEVVTDNISRLKWEDSSHTKRELNFSEAENYCENLELGGITDWRVPTNKELLYLADRSKHNPALNSIFQNFVSINSLWKGFYWSNQAVTYSGRENENWILNSYNGNDFLEKRTENGYVRCVSGNSHYEDIQFERDNSKEIVKDLTHNLMWVDGGETVKKSWSEAISYCKNLNYGGYSDWRLPTIEELYSITDQRKSSAPFVNSEFNNIKSGFSDWYWSSTEYNGNKSYSWKLNFYNGYDNYYNRSNSSCVRCLR